MDLHTSVCAIFLFLFTVFLSFVLGWKRKSNGRLSCLPGPFPMPIIGNLHQLGALPHRTLQRLTEKHGSIMSLKLGSVDVVVASSSEAAKQFLKTDDSNFANRPSVGAAKYLFYNDKDIVFAPYGEYWRNMRKLRTVELLNAHRIESFKGVREEETGDGEIDLGEERGGESGSGCEPDRGVLHLRLDVANIDCQD